MFSLVSFVVKVKVTIFISVLMRSHISISIWKRVSWNQKLNL